MYGDLRRRLVHVAGSGLPLAYLLGVLDWRDVQTVLLAGTVAAAALEALRLTGRVDWRIFDELTREYERENVAGYVYYVVGMALTVVVFDPRVAVPAVLMLTVGDPISGVLGAGELAKARHVLLVMFAVCVAIAAPFVPVGPAVAGAVTATVADGLKPVVWGYVVDDNLTIPLGAATAMALALRVL